MASNATATCVGPSLDVSIVLPCLNEERTVGVCIDKLKRAMRPLRITYEIIVSDNDSNDNSRVVAERAGARLVECSVKGYGAALCAGFAAARGRLLLMADSDDSYDLQNVVPFIVALESGADFVIGNRFLGGISRGAMPWLHRYFGTPLITGLVNCLFGSNIGDIYCGIRGFTREAYQKMQPRCIGMEFACELVVRAIQLRLQIAQIPTILYPDGRDRPPHLRTFSDGWRSIQYLFRERFCRSTGIEQTTNAARFIGR